MKCKLGICTWLEDEKDVCCYDCPKVYECWNPKNYSKYDEYYKNTYKQLRKKDRRQ